MDQFGSQLALIAPCDEKEGAVVFTPVAYAKALGPEGWLAANVVNSVPIGKGARASFEKLDFWSTVQPRVASGYNVRAALLLISRGEVRLGGVCDVRLAAFETLAQQPRRSARWSSHCLGEQAGGGGDQVLRGSHETASGVNPQGGAQEREKARSIKGASKCQPPRAPRAFISSLSGRALRIVGWLQGGGGRLGGYG